MTADGRAQTLTVRDWMPQWNPNGTGNRSHWATLQKRKRADEVMAWAAARQAGWVRIPGKVRLEIVFVYPRKVRVDTDNLYSRVKGLVDGLKKEFFEDDSTDVLDLHVTAVVEPGTKETRMTLRAE